MLPLSAQGQLWPFDQIVSFGDSLTDQGNVVKTYGPLLSTFGVTTNAYNENFYDDGRITNGPVWAELLSLQLGAGTLERSTNGGTNYAWAATRSGSGFSSFILPNLLTQVTGYVGSNSGHNTKLFTIWSGGNDLLDVIGGSYDMATVASTVAANIAQAVTNLAGAGAKYLLVHNLPNLGLKPDYVGNASLQNEATDLAFAVNVQLELNLQQVENEFSGLTIVRGDTFGLITDIVANPSFYGLTNVTETAYTPDSTEDG
ncbi:MAG: SGNH/GDSL hydrolase family protein [Verrucomicrobiales bacterium]